MLVSTSMYTQTFENVSMTDGKDAIRELVAKQIRETEQELMKLNQIMATLAAKPGDLGQLPSSLEFVHMGVTDAAKKFLEEKKFATTREIADGLLARGLKTRSDNFLNTVYATLANAKTIFMRKDKKWYLVPAKK